MESGTSAKPSKIPIQVVFQGGGAKLCVLMAVCEALKTDTRIEITRVAGSSAGAITAVMLASSKPLGTYKAELKSLAPKYIDTLSTWKWRGAYRVYRGGAYFHKLSLRNFFRELFCVGSGLQYVSDLRPVEAKLYFTDLYSLQAHEAPPDDPIPVALEKSCRFPFAFVGFGSGNTQVDGGLALNFPVDELKNDESTKGSVIGVSFTNNFSEEGKNTLYSYTERLFSAAIQSGVVRSEAILGKRNVFPIETDINTFDFDKALTDGLGRHYDDVVLQFKTWFDDWLKSYGPIEPERPAHVSRLIRPPLSNIHLDKAIIRDLQDRLRSDPPTYAKSVEQYDEALFDDRGSFTGKYKCKSMIVFKVLRPTNVLEFNFQIGRGSLFTAANLGCAALNSRGVSLRFRPDVQEVTMTGDSLRTFRVYFFFEQPLEPTDPDQPFVVEYQCDANESYPKLGIGIEHAVLIRRTGDAEKALLGVAFPREKLFQPNVLEIATASAEQLKKADYNLDPGEEFIPSAKMAQADLVRAMDLKLPPEKYFLVGRCVEQIRVGQSFGFLIE